MINVDKIRSLFRFFTKVNGRNLIYFDNAASSQKPQIVLNTINHYYANENANIHRGVHYLSQKATDKFEETRSAVQEFINAKIDVKLSLLKEQPTLSI